MMEEKEEKYFCQALIIRFFLTKNRIWMVTFFQDYVLGFQALLDSTQAKSEHHSLEELIALSASEFTKLEFLKLQTVPMKKTLH